MARVIFYPYQNNYDDVQVDKHYMRDRSSIKKLSIWLANPLYLSLWIKTEGQKIHSMQSGKKVVVTNAGISAFQQSKIEWLEWKKNN